MSPGQYAHLHATIEEALVQMSMAAVEIPTSDQSESAGTRPMMA